jgi:hypothetical protein
MKLDDIYNSTSVRDILHTWIIISVVFLILKKSN